VINSILLSVENIKQNLTVVEDALRNYYESSHDELKGKALKHIIDSVVETHMMVANISTRFGS